jgi:phage portal protein BeeE
VALGNLDQLGKLHWHQIKNGVHAGHIFYLLAQGNNPERFKQAVALLKAGIGKAGEPIVLPKGRVEVANAPVGNEDMKFVELAKLSRQEALGARGGSDALVGITRGESRANLWAKEWALATGTVDPLNGLIADAYNAYLLPLYGPPGKNKKLVLSYQSSQMVDESDLINNVAAKKKAGIIDQNESREELGYVPVAGGTGKFDTDIPKTSPSGSKSPGDIQAADANAESDA